ncbi:MAG TPA: glutamine--tRNA ligase [Burkholderiaceae bacterium]|jgi:glutaminyl-tRNA synthetase|nr:glutamine--tRNA ligase [Burkholderiaceae bacterium]
MNRRDAPRPPAAANFIRNIVDADLAKGRFARRRWNGRPGDGTFQRQGPPETARIRTRFPPEPNGYLHVGHAKSIWLNFGLARDYHGRCHMRFDDTNPEKEEQEYVDSILDAVRWMGFDWTEGAHSHLYYASDYFDQLYEYAEYLIRTGHAYVDEQSAEQLRGSRGTLTEAGRDSPFRGRPADESLERFRQMRDGRHPEGSMVLRARIDMASPNINMRDPTLYRIRFAHHHRTGDRWCIYPMYDYTHSISDALESITHSLCTLEFEDHRPLYDWCVERLVPTMREPQWREALELVQSLREQGLEVAREFALHCHNFRHKLYAGTAEANLRSMFERWEHDRAAVMRDLDVFYKLLLGKAEQFAPLLAGALEDLRPDPFDLPHQYEFSRLNVNHVLMSKRKLIQLVEEQLVDGWDDPRMPTIVGLRRRGYTPRSLQLFSERIGVSKAESWIDYPVLEQALRDDLDPIAPRAVAVLEPLRLVITNLAVGHSEPCVAPVHPHRPELGTRTIPLTRELWIERDDFAERPPPDYFRLYPGNLVRLRYAYVIRCTGVEKNDLGHITAVLAEYLPDTRSGTDGANRVKVKGAIHWLPAEGCPTAEVRLYEQLFTVAQPDAGGRDFRESINPVSRRVLTAFVEAAAAAAQPEDRLQFERHGYFVADQSDHTPGRPVFNRITTLRDSRSK